MNFYFDLRAKTNIIASSRLSFVCPCEVLCDGNQTKQILKQQNQLNKNQLKPQSGNKVYNQNETSDKILEKNKGYNSTYEPSDSTENVSTEMSSTISIEDSTIPFTLKYPIYTSHLPGIKTEQKEKLGSLKNLQIIEENDKDVKTFNPSIGHQLLIDILTTGKPSNETSRISQYQAETSSSSTIGFETINSFVNESKPYTKSSNLNLPTTFTSSNGTKSIQ